MASDTLQGRPRCWRCSGTGIVEWARHYANGVCFMCKGVGTVEGGASVLHEGVHNLQVGDLVWQFSFINEAGYTTPDVASFATGMLQCFSAGSRRRDGITLLSARVSTLAVLREVFRRAKRGEQPEAITAASMGLREPSCSISRNRRGIESL